MLDPYSAEDAALRAVARADLHAAHRAYAALPEIEKRAYAAAHPSFVASLASPLPEAVRWQMVDAEAAEGPDAAHAVYTAYVRRTAMAGAAADRAAGGASMAERAILAGAWAAGIGAGAVVIVPTAYVAAGPHGAAVALTGLGLFAVLAVARRLVSRAV